MEGWYEGGREVEVCHVDRFHLTSYLRTSITSTRVQDIAICRHEPDRRDSCRSEFLDSILLLKTAEVTCKTGQVINLSLPLSMVKIYPFLETAVNVHKTTLTTYVEVIHRSFNAEPLVERSLATFDGVNITVVTGQ